jgi:hypothetical protein
MSSVTMRVTTVPGGFRKSRWEGDSFRSVERRIPAEKGPNTTRDGCNGPQQSELIEKCAMIEEKLNELPTESMTRQGDCRVLFRDRGN